MGDAPHRKAGGVRTLKQEAHRTSPIFFDNKLITRYMNNKNIIHIEGSEFWGRYIYLTAAQGFALVKLIFDNRCSKGVCEIGEVNTHPCKQRQGYATMLMQEAERIAKENGCTVIQLWTKKDSWMQVWYERMGFVVQDFMTPPSDDTVWLCKGLTK